MEHLIGTYDENRSKCTIQISFVITPRQMLQIFAIQGYRETISHMNHLLVTSQNFAREQYLITQKPTQRTAIDWYYGTASKIVGTNNDTAEESEINSWPSRDRAEYSASQSFQPSNSSITQWTAPERLLVSKIWLSFFHVAQQPLSTSCLFITRSSSRWRAEK